MKIMVNDISATSLSEKPHVNADLKRRAQSLVDNKSIDAATRNVLRYGLEIDDPVLADLVRRVESGEGIIDNQGFLKIEE